MTGKASALHKLLIGGIKNCTIEMKDYGEYVTYICQFHISLAVFTIPATIHRSMFNKKTITELYNEIVEHLSVELFYVITNA